MPYVKPDYRTKRELRLAVAQGKEVEVYMPGLVHVPEDGVVFLEGPAFKNPTWHAKGTMKEGKLVKIT